MSKFRLCAVAMQGNNREEGILSAQGKASLEQLTEKVQLLNWEIRMSSHSHMTEEN